MTITDADRRLIPEECCAHRELRDARSLSRGWCRDCGSWVDIEPLRTVTQEWHEEQVGQAYDEGYTDGHDEAERDAGQDIRALERQITDMEADIARAITMLDADSRPSADSEATRRQVAAMLRTVLDRPE